MVILTRPSVFQELEKRVAHEKHKLASMAGENGNEGSAAYTPATQHFQVAPSSHLTRASSPKYSTEIAPRERQVCLSQNLGFLTGLRYCWHFLGARCLIKKTSSCIQRKGATTSALKDRVKAPQLGLKLATAYVLSTPDRPAHLLNLKAR